MKISETKTIAQHSVGHCNYKHLQRSAQSQTPNASLASDLNSVVQQASDFIETQYQQQSGNNPLYDLNRSEIAALQNPVRYLGNEVGSQHKPWDSAQVRFVLSYPEVYEVGASNLGHQILYSCLNEMEGVLCDRAYLPADDLADLLREKQIALGSVENRRALVDFDILGLSLAYELGGSNILELLSLARIPITRQERMKQEDLTKPFDVTTGSYPIVFAGGPTATSNPEPYSDFLDAFAIGDGEEMLPDMALCLQKCKAEGLNKRDTLYRLATTVPGVYVPQFYDMPQGFGGAVFPNTEGVPLRVVRRVSDPAPQKHKHITPNTATVFKNISVEIRRGCTRGCRFCQPGMLTRPARDVPPEDVEAAVSSAIKSTGNTEISLLSLSCSDYLALPHVGLNIKKKFKEDGVKLSLPSQRVDRFDDSIGAILKGGSTESGLTFAPEAGTQRLRDIINKGLSDEELMRGVGSAWAQGWKKVKLYFMIGLPGETDEDVLGIADTVERLQAKFKRGNRSIKVTLTISNFTPKPHTPFQWHSVSTEEFIRKQSLLKERFDRQRAVKVSYTDPRLSAMEDFLARGDRRIGPVIQYAWENGAKNIQWWYNVEAAYEAWQHAIDKMGMSWKYREVRGGEWNTLEALGDGRYRKQGGSGKGRLDRGDLADTRLNMLLPWDHIDTGVSKQWLKSDLQKALEAITVPDCSHSQICTSCGVCDDQTSPPELPSTATPPPPTNPAPLPAPPPPPPATFGNNVTQPPLPVMDFSDPSVFRRSDAISTRVTRLRFSFRKHGESSWISNISTQDLFIQAAKRADLPVAIGESRFVARPRVSLSAALPIGSTSDQEWVEYVLYQHVDVNEAKRNLQAQLPRDIVITSAYATPAMLPDGANSPHITTLFESSTYQVLMCFCPGSGVEGTPTTDSGVAKDVRRFMSESSIEGGPGMVQEEEGEDERGQRKGGKRKSKKSGKNKSRGGVKTVQQAQQTVGSSSDEGLRGRNDGGGLDADVSQSGESVDGSGNDSVDGSGNGSVEGDGPVKVCGTCSGGNSSVQAPLLCDGSVDVEQVLMRALALDEYHVTAMTKKNKKEYDLEIRKRVTSLKKVDLFKNNKLLKAAADALKEAAMDMVDRTTANTWAVVQYTSTGYPGEQTRHVTAEYLAKMLGEVGGCRVRVVHIHRVAYALNETEESIKDVVNSI